MSEYHFPFDDVTGLRSTSKVSNEPAPASLAVNHRSEDVGIAQLTAGHYVAELPENIYQQLLFGIMQHHIVTKYECSTTPGVPSKRSFQHILVY